MNQFFSAWLSVGNTNRRIISRKIEAETKYHCNESTVSRAICYDDKEPRFVVIREAASRMMQTAVTEEVAKHIKGLRKTDRIMVDTNGEVHVFDKDFVHRGSYRP